MFLNPTLGNPKIQCHLGRMIPTPAQLFRSFENGELGRDELHSLLALHARELIVEMEEDHQNPAAAWLEGVLARRLMSRLVRQHGSKVVREVLCVLAEVPDFPPARYLWNAAHPDVPLYCFLRMRREPFFRLTRIEPSRGGLEVRVEFNTKGQELVKKTLFFARGADWKLTLSE